MRNWLALVLAVVVVRLAALGYTSFSSGVPVEAAAGTTRRDARICRRRRQDPAGRNLSRHDALRRPHRADRPDRRHPGHQGPGRGPDRAGGYRSQKSPAKAIVDRLKASIKRERRHVSVEPRRLQQTVNMVESIDRMVEAAEARVKSGKAKLEYAEKFLARAAAPGQKRRDQTEDEARPGPGQQVESSVEYQQDKLVLRSAEAMRAAMALLPTMVRQYIQRKVLAARRAGAAAGRSRSQHARGGEKRATGHDDQPGRRRRAGARRQQRAAGGRRHACCCASAAGRIWKSKPTCSARTWCGCKPGQTVEVHGPTIGPSRPSARSRASIRPASPRPARWASSSSGSR